MVGVRRKALVRLGLLAALAAPWLGAPAVARAGCGDYVAYGPHAITDHARPAEAPSVPTPAPYRCPCRGPMCSGGTPVPLLPVTTAPLTPDPWACLEDVSGAAGRDRRVWWPAPEPPAPHDCVRTIFHPPRLS